MRGYLIYFVLMLLLLPVCAQAEENSAHITEFFMPQGDRLVEFSWHKDGGIVLLVESPDGLALRWLDLGKYETYNITIPQQFSKLKPTGNDGFELELAFSPDGTHLTAFKRFSGPLRQNDLQVFRVKKEGSTWLTTRNIPATFWINDFAWDENSKALYLAAKPYGSPEQKFSIGAYTPADKSFNGIVLRSDLDVVHDIAHLNGRNKLAVYCGGVAGEYPTEPAVLLYDLEQRRAEMLHARAGGLRLASTDSGMLLVMNCNDAGKLSAGGHWVLGPNESSLRPCELDLQDATLAAKSSADGRWFGILNAQGKDGEYRLALQRASDGWSLLSQQSVKSQHFNRESTKVGAADSNGTKLYLYWLPTD